MTTKSPYFCVLPWYSREIIDDTVTPCCLLPNGHDLNKIKQDLLNGIPSEFCQKCWSLESQNIDSRRLQENKFLDFKLNRDISTVENDCITGNNKILMYQVKLSNLCNQACVTCNSSASTKWGELDSKESKKSIVIRKKEIQDFDIDYKNAQRIYILGGEPLFDPALTDLLDNLLAHGNTDCFLSFITNGSVKLTTRMKNLLRSFSNLNICVSVDGIEKRFEYMRWPGNWSELLYNIDDYRLITNDNISISYTISAVNAIYYDETTRWFKSNSLRYNHNIVHDPLWCSLPQMPVVLKQHLEHHEFFKHWTKISGTEITRELLFNNLQKQDNLKKISLADYLPELYRLVF